jgi:hypothetical protein
MSAGGMKLPRSSPHSSRCASQSASGPSPGSRTATATTALPTSIAAHRSYKTRMSVSLLKVGRSARGPRSPQES